MEQNRQKELQDLCYHLGKATGAAIRLYLGQVCLYYYSIYHLHPDPADPFLDQLLNPDHAAGVFVTPLNQSYGFWTIDEGLRVVIGPSRMENEEPRLLEEQLFLLGVEQDRRKDYVHTLRCFPSLSAERMGWAVSFLCSVADHRPFPMDELYVNIRPEVHATAVQTDLARRTEREETSLNIRELLDRAYQFERIILSYVEQGEPDRLRELFSAPPSVMAGPMADDALRQRKNAGICCATIASRAAIAGGVDNRTAFHMSDLYIQKIELLRDGRALEKLQWDMFVDFAEQVRQVRYHTKSSEKSGEKDLFLACSEYVSQNIYAPIRAEELADALGYTRSYLCSCFKRQTGMTLTQYCLQEKILEAQRMLRFTDQSLSEIAALFAFSSQSHFQTVFKRITGETPLSYRHRMR